MRIEYQVEAGIVLPTDDWYPDDWGYESEEFEDAAEVFLGIDLWTKAAFMDADGTLHPGEGLYKRFTVVKYDDTGAIEDTALIVYEDQHTAAPALKTVDQIMERLFDLGYSSVDDFVEHIF